MDLQKFTSDFASQFEDTDASEFTPATKFQDLDEWGSLSGLAILALIDEDYNVKVSGAEVRKCVTIEDVYNLVLSKKS